MNLLQGRYLTDRWHALASTFPVTSPATGNPLGDVANCGAEHASAAIEISWRAFEEWRVTTPFERATILRRWFELIMEQQSSLAELMTAEMGKTLREARGEAAYAASFVEWYAEEGKRTYGSWIPSHARNKRQISIRQPVGPVYAVTPWNFPAAMITRKAAPALAAGCTMILKPAEQTPFTALRLAELWLEAGGPAGTLQVLPTMDPAGVTAVMMADPRVRKVTFTGSTEVGRLLYRQAAQTIKKISFELGGHAPYLVFDDADVERAVREVTACKFRNNGQTCVCTNRVYVQDGIHDEFVAAFAAAVGRLTLGDPMDEATDVGPLVDLQGLAKVEDHVQDAVAKGATVVVGGAVTRGLYYPPTLLSNVAPGMKILEEETFGPDAPVLRFNHESEEIAHANSTPYGLAAYLYTENLARALRVSEALDFGIIGVNDGIPAAAHVPFGGVKQSGIGREGGPWGIEEYLETKYISLGLA